MAHQQIHCSINNCHYWDDGNLCRADQILVTSDMMAKTLPQEINAPLAAQVTQTPVGDKVESCCKTFIQKNAYQQNADGVLRQ